MTHLKSKDLPCLALADIYFKNIRLYTVPIIIKTYYIYHIHMYISVLFVNNVKKKKYVNNRYIYILFITF